MRRGDWVRPRPSASGYRRDAVVAGVLAVAAWVSSLLYLGAVDQPHAPPWATAIWAVVIAGSLAFRRRMPELVALVVSVTFVTGQYNGVYEQLFANICLFLAIYSVGAWGHNRMLATAVRVVITTGMVLWLVGVLVYQAITPDSMPGVSHDGVTSQFLAIGLIQIITNLLYFGAAIVFGNAAYSAAEEREALTERTAELEREREVSSRQAVALERVRIAQELHDVVAHHVSVMGLQAGAARRILSKGASAVAGSAASGSGVTGSAVAGSEPATGVRTDPNPDPRVIEALGVIESNGREAVDELHRMLGALRQEEPGPEGGPGGSGRDASGLPSASRSTSTRGVEQLPELIREAEATGLPIEWTTIGEAQPVPPAIGLTLYRIAQESLTNVRKHAGPRATVDLRLRYLPGAVELEISDTGAGVAAAGGAGRTAASAGGANASGTGALGTGAPGAGAGGGSASGALGAASRRGLGQIGMRERVNAAGGELELGPRSRGGYRVRARLPLGAPRREDLG